MIEEIEKRLVEVEVILKQLDIQYKEKIPNEIWEYINKHKSKDYIYTYDSTIDLENQKINLDTVAILSYINIKYLLNKTQKEKFLNLLKADEIFAENEKRKRYNPDNLFKEKELKQENINKWNELAVTYQETWFTKFLNKIKKLFNK